MLSRQIKNSVEELLKIISSFTVDTKEYEFFIKLESSISFNQLNDILISIANSNEEDPTKLFAPLITFFANRWDHIQKTDAIYLHTPQTRMNRACLMAANLASIYLHIHPYELLMPTLQCHHYYFPEKGNLKNLALHEFILGDDGHPIDVLQTLMIDENQNHPKRNQSKIFYKIDTDSGKLKRMTCLEQLRLVNHSDQVQDYCLMLNGCENLNVQKNKLEEAFDSKTYIVTASYGKEGDRCLKKNVFEEVKSVQDLTDLMITHLSNKRDWQTFLNSAPSEDLCRIILNINYHELELKYATPAEFEKALLEMADTELNKLVQKNLGWVVAEEQIRAHLLCLLEIYKRARNVAPESRSNTGYYASYVMPSWMSGSFNKNTKLNSSSVFGDFLISECPLHDLEGYLKKRGLYKDHWNPLTVNPYFFGVSTLVKLVQIATDAGRKLESQSLHYAKLQ